MALSDFTPTTAEVAAHMRARLKDDNGNYNDDFTAETRPTKATIESWLPWGARRIASHIGTTICEGKDAERQAELYADAKDAAALRIAIRAERSFFPEQLQSERSPYKAMVDELVDEVKTLIESVAEHCGGGGGESVGGPGPLPSSSFPAPSGVGGGVW